MNKEKIIELKKWLENEDEVYYNETCYNILTYINEIESENESCYEVLADLKTIIKQQNDRIAELEKENGEQLKQFAERLKEKMSEGEYLGHKYKLAVFRDIDIDETLNEFLKGENNE